MNKKAKMGLTILLIIIIGAAALIFIRQLKNRKLQMGEEQNLGVPVETTEVKKDDFQIIYNYSGTVEYAGKRKISAQIGGEITDIYVEEGETLKKGDLLAKIEDQKLKNNLNSAQAAVKEAENVLKKAKLSKEISENNLIESRAALNEAQSNYSQWKSDYNRDKKLYHKNAIAEAKFEQTKTQFKKAAAQIEKMKAAVASAEKSVEIAELNIKNSREKLKKAENEFENARLELKDTEIKSPITAKVVREFAEEGELIGVGQPLFEIARPERLEVKVQVGMKDLNKLKVGTKVLISFPALKNRNLEAEISEIDSTADLRSRTTEVTIIFKENNLTLKDGSFVAAALVAESYKDVIIIPERAIFNYQNKSHVYLIEEGKAVRKKIKKGASNGYFTIVRSSLAPGDKIAVSNLNDLQDKQKVYLSEQENGDD
ncbi:RND family efflux transporter MFP subunit [Halanaerobium saccharolyticum]|uniref:RND family efflux transporter MFP subunit n=1 Tax=Halanaerobium saccharolyticum TaxID=43595 RepID=A0A4R7Z345_9FIRM|nr:efflux RND transporter periplasmic adaptor subunit [Halanaerobium saccharolyticum]RAK08483.1 RND family efflux transporter MFP subunit [Halanaerobium saccharolyticum]TDW03482.1 RND family efflux transporter MFP subunit [Halanaerobium saccharolyticum]TDX59975.1 RND family efflux transporter MFP subunit [Halanaerobium saccharolyticum]